MKRIATIVIAMLVMLESASVYAWGPMGHDVVAAIAEQHLTKKAKKNIDKLLGGKSIVYYASWMDNIQNSPYWKNGYNKTKTWHYANVDEGFTYQTMQKNKDGDVVSGLEFLTGELTNRYDELTDSMRVDYLKMIVHMVGDLHCPMHAGRLSDRGGNKTKVKWFGQQTNIHSVWDSKMIESARKWSYSGWVEQLDVWGKQSTAVAMAVTKCLVEFEARYWFMVSNASEILVLPSSGIFSRVSSSPTVSPWESMLSVWPQL